MIRRRFVNLVSEDHITGARSLRRLDAAKHLFYPSTAAAEAAQAKEEEYNNNNNNGAAAAIPNPTSIRRLRRLPPPSLRFPAGFSDGYRPPPYEEDDTFFMRRLDDDTVVHLSHHANEGKILHASGDDGHAVLYDAGSGSAAVMPSIGRPLGSRSTFVSVAGVGEEGGGCLYAMTNHRGQHGFQVLDLNQRPLKWDPLPLPPFASSPYTYYIRSLTVVYGGDTICVSTASNNNGTYCFDTASHEWSKAGDWMLPFHGRAEYIPELDTWIGLCADDHRLCACSDLAAAIAEPHRAPPTLQHEWKYLTLPPHESERVVLKGRQLRGFSVRRSRYWRSPFTADLVNLGGGRFCVATVVRDQRTVSFNGESETMIDAAFVVLNGMEVVRGGGDDGEEGVLRMVKHKSRRYVFTGHKIEWVL